jgi:hypothetical protein
VWKGRGQQKYGSVRKYSIGTTTDKLVNATSKPILAVKL